MADRNHADAAADGTPEEGGQQPDRGPEVLLVTTETSGQHRVPRCVVLHQGGALVEEERYALPGSRPPPWVRAPGHEEVASECDQVQRRSRLWFREEGRVLEAPR